jgi:ubiquitin-conjugating enzyme E2 variant
MHCGDQYPDKPPTIQFISEVNLPCVNPRNGVVSIAEYIFAEQRDRAG